MNVHLQWPCSHPLPHPPKQQHRPRKYQKNIYAYIYIYTYIYMIFCLSMYLFFIYLCMYVCMHVCMYVCMHVCIYYTYRNFPLCIIVTLRLVGTLPGSQPQPPAAGKMEWPPSRSPWPPPHEASHCCHPCRGPRGCKFHGVTIKGFRVRV